MNIIFKNLKSIILFIGILLPIFFYYSIDSISHKTYEKKHFLVKKNEPNFLKRFKLEKQPIINAESIKEFAKASIITIFNYETPFAVEKIKNNEKLFSELGFESFVDIFEFLIEEERDNGILVKKTTVVEGPYLLGSFRFIDKNAYQIYMKTQETTKGFNEIPVTETKNVFVIIIEGDFSNSKGLSLESLSIN